MYAVVGLSPDDVRWNISIVDALHYQLVWWSQCFDRSGEKGIGLRRGGPSAIINATQFFRRASNR